VETSCGRAVDSRISAVIDDTFRGATGFGRFVTGEPANWPNWHGPYWHDFGLIVVITDREVIVEKGEQGSIFSGQGPQGDAPACRIPIEGIQHVESHWTLLRGKTVQIDFARARGTDESIQLRLRKRKQFLTALERTATRTPPRLPKRVF
jgi:hypothetical protein